MATDEKWFSAKQLAGLPRMPTTVQKVTRKALREAWLSRPAPAEAEAANMPFPPSPRSLRRPFSPPSDAPVAKFNRPSADSGVISWEETWNRVKQITGWHRSKDLAQFLQITSTSVSQAKVAGYFYLGWLNRIREAYRVNFHWLVTGNGPSKADDIERAPQGRNSEPQKCPFSIFFQNCLNCRGRQ